jgi:hypothetical protein
MQFYVKHLLPHHINYIHQQEARHKRTTLFQEDNNRSHRTRSVYNIARIVKANGHLSLLAYPANLPDLNPPEAVWRAMKQYLHGGD